MKRYWLLFLLMILTWIGGCSKKDAPVGEFPESFIALSFDDTYIDNWYNSLPLLDSLNIRATFYISAYHTLSPAQKDKLRIIESHQNEIAYHTTNHANLELLYNKKGMKYLIDTEITPDLEQMRRDGFRPANFAFPFGRHDDNLDRQLLNYFQSVRAVCNPKTYNKSLVKRSSESHVLYAPGIDSREKITDDDIENLVALAKSNRDCVMFYAHSIDNPNSRFHVTTEILQYLASLRQKYDLRFQTVKD